MHNDDKLSTLRKIDNKISGLYLLLIGVVLALISLYKDKADILDKKYGTNYSNNYPDTNKFDLIIAINRIIANSIFLYYSWDELKKMAGSGRDNAELEPLYNVFYAQLFDLVSSSIDLYNSYRFGEGAFVS